MVRAPGLEPGFRRWQRPVITTPLRSLGLFPIQRGINRYRNNLLLLKTKSIIIVIALFSSSGK